jgi:hypothetical protein
MKFIIIRDSEQGASIFTGRKFNPKTTVGCTTKAQLRRRIESVKKTNAEDWFVADFDSVDDAVDALKQANAPIRERNIAAYVPVSAY